MPVQIRRIAFSTALPFCLTASATAADTAADAYGRFVAAEHAVAEAMYSGENPTNTDAPAKAATALGELRAAADQLRHLAPVPEADRAAVSQAHAQADQLARFRLASAVRSVVERMPTDPATGPALTPAFAAFDAAAGVDAVLSGRPAVASPVVATHPPGEVVTVRVYGLTFDLAGKPLVDDHLLARWRPLRVDQWSEVEDARDGTRVYELHTTADPAAVAAAVDLGALVTLAETRTVCVVVAFDRLAAIADHPSPTAPGRVGLAAAVTPNGARGPTPPGRAGDTLALLCQQYRADLRREVDLLGHVDASTTVGQARARFGPVWDDLDELARRVRALPATTAAQASADLRRLAVPTGDGDVGLQLMTAGHAAGQRVGVGSPVAKLLAARLSGVGDGPFWAEVVQYPVARRLVDQFGPDRVVTVVITGLAEPARQGPRLADHLRAELHATAAAGYAPPAGGSWVVALGPTSDPEAVRGSVDFGEADARPRDGLVVVAADAKRVASVVGDDRRMPAGARAGLAVQVLQADGSWADGTLLAVEGRRFHVRLARTAADADGSPWLDAAHVRPADAH